MSSIEIKLYCCLSNLNNDFPVGDKGKPCLKILTRMGKSSIFDQRILPIHAARIVTAQAILPTFALLPLCFLYALHPLVMSKIPEHKI